MNRPSQLALDISVFGPEEVPSCRKFCSILNRDGHLLVTNLSELSVYQGCIMWGSRVSHPVQRMIHHTVRASQGASWYDENEGIGQNVRLMASYRQRY